MKDVLYAAGNAVTELGGRVYQSGALGHGGVPAKPDWPFALFREMEVVPHRAVQSTSRSARHDYQFYIYDERGSYARIERLLGELRETLLSQEGQRSPGGVQCTGVEWFGTSGDLVNEELNSNTRYVIVRITANT